MATVRFSEADRDQRGFIRLSPPSADDATTAPAPSIPGPRVARPTTPAQPRLSPRLHYQLTMAAACVAGLVLVLLTVRFSSTQPSERSASVLAAPTLAP